MANTTNLNLSKLSGTEKLKTFPTPYSDNMDAIDGAFGAGFGVSGKPTVNAEINSLADGLAIISNNNTHAAITAGQFVYVRGHGSLSNGLYVATSNISANGTLSGSNLTADTAGGLNALNSNKANAKGLGYNSTVVSCSTTSEIETAIANTIAVMENNQTAILRLNVTVQGAMLAGGSWNANVFRGSANYYTAIFVTYGHNVYQYVYANGTKSWDSFALNSNMQWKELGIKTGTEKFSYPTSEWSEVFIQVATTTGYRVNVPINILNASINRNNDCYFRTGNYASESSNSSMIIHTDSTGINLYSFYLDGSDLTSTATVRIFYR